MNRSLRILGHVIVLVLVLAVAAYASWYFFLRYTPPAFEEGGIKRVSTVEGERLAVYDGQEGGFEPKFWNGVNLGATLPGHAPGELAPSRDDYLRWFSEMSEMNSDVVRVYTILNPEFYEALEEYNAGRASRGEEPLWLVQGIWSPEEELIGENEEGNDAYSPEITQEFEEEIREAVRVVHGDARLPEQPGHASGSFGADVSPYMLGWMVGTEWYPYAVQETDEAHPGMEPFSGEYFRATDDASPFESWLAGHLEVLAEEEMRYGWQHPVALTNWLTTDPLPHPNEPSDQEDLASVDPMHLEPTEAWEAGYFASFHVYPYFPDFLRYEEDYQNYRAEDGEVDPYAGYLNDLRAHHEGIPLVVAEFGLPTSRGMAHEGALGRDQGHHTEEEQGEMEAEMLQRMREEGYDGAFHFAWQDEWFKFTWNTKDLNIPDERRPMWPNKLTNEQNFGVIANAPGNKEDAIYLDGGTGDWERRAGTLNAASDLLYGDDTGVTQQSYPGFDLSVAHDEGYLYLMARKREGDWDLDEEALAVGFGHLPRGAEEADETPGLRFPGSAQTLLRIGGDDPRMYINSAYDYHTWLYSYLYNYVARPENASDAEAGNFVPWKLMLNRPLYLPESEQRVPSEEFDVGAMQPGVTDPESPDFDNLADYHVEGDVLEIRIPWMMLGFTDPSAHMVWDDLYATGEISPVETEELRVYPAQTTADARSATGPADVQPLTYRWDGWDEPNSHERRKKSYDILREAFADERLQEP